MSESAAPNQTLSIATVGRISAPQPASDPLPEIQPFKPLPGRHVKPPVAASALRHSAFDEGLFWQRIPAYAEVDTATFLDFRWQGRHSITSPEKLLAAIQGVAPAEFVQDAARGFGRSPMSVRVTPYLLSLIDWSDPYQDPLRRQFIPLGSQLQADHPELTLDSLHEQEDAPVPGLTHRYPDKALFLALDTCPVYCRFCTRSYAVGLDTELVDKVHLNADTARWDQILAYIATRPELEDIVLSGGDVYNLPARHIRMLGERLLHLPNIRRIRFATKGPAVMPQKLLTDQEWTRALCDVVAIGRQLRKDVVLHTHFNHPREITWITRDALGLLAEFGVHIRNQSVLQYRVNDNVDTCKLLVKRLGAVGVHPYYVYVHDLVKGVEDLRTTLQKAIDLEKAVRGVTAGFNTPTFVVDTLGGGGKRDAHSYDFYDRDSGIAVFSSPNVDPEKQFYFFDPIAALQPNYQARWADPVERERMKAKASVMARALRGHR
ncbi:MAG: KamA family radical SAM protein [Deltaproteobacteria bacterium]|nr:KamA family radical SAM protein [Deltaproteobacteria bacterium]